MSLTVRQSVEAMQRLGVLTPRDLEVVQSRWFRAGRPEAEDPAKFRHWLATNHFLPPFAYDVVSAGQGEQLILNQYRVVDQLKTGPLAGAYLATDPLRRQVVIQVASREISADPARLELIRRIVQEATRLQHPNVCRVLEFGEARGRHYLVREYDEASSLGDVLKRRGKLPAEQAARIFALACEGLRALHEHQIPGGLLNAECVLLASTGKGPRPQRTVRLLVAAARSNVFDRRAIGGREDAGSFVIPDDAELVALADEQGAARAAKPEEDILRLGCLFYQCVTGKVPFPPDQLPRPGYRATPVAEAAPDVPESLAEIIEGMIDPDPARRPKSAAHVAKALRVFLQAQEEAREVREEDQVVIAAPPPARRAAVAAAEEEEEEPEERPQRARGQKPGESRESALDRLWSVWEEVRPQPRDWMFLAGGVAGVVLLVLLVELFTGLRFVHVVLLTAGAGISFLVERAVAWWSGTADPREPGNG